jgi:hypothetical protein
MRISLTGYLVKNEDCSSGTYASVRRSGNGTDLEMVEPSFSVSCVFARDADLARTIRLNAITLMSGVSGDLWSPRNERGNDNEPKETLY